MSNNKYKNFDKFFTELDKKNDIIIEVYGKEYRCPGSIPAIIMIKTQAMLKQKDREMKTSEQLDIAWAMIGKTHVEEWVNEPNNMTMEQLGEIIKWVAEQHTGKAANNSAASKK